MKTWIENGMFTVVLVPDEQIASRDRGSRSGDQPATRGD